LSEKWAIDISDMHDFYGMTEGFGIAIARGLGKDLLRFRLDFIQEEVTEMNLAFDEKNPEEIIDALIDICVVAIGTLDAFNIDAHEAWNQVLAANMAKQPGVKESRPNPFGLPDLIKPEGWTAPDHSGNHGFMANIFEKEKVAPVFPVGPCEV
jgi:predicted HAD superfamily Cof-like phosphohydrolase